MHVFGHMLFGLVVGIVARILMPGHVHGGLLVTILLGVVGAWAGGWIGRMLGLYPANHPAGLIMAVLGAVVVLFVYGYIERPRSTRADSLPHAHIMRAFSLAITVACRDAGSLKRP